jgi:hypothetical protein
MINFETFAILWFILSAVVLLVLFVINIKKPHTYTTAPDTDENGPPY